MVAYAIRRTDLGRNRSAENSNPSDGPCHVERQLLQLIHSLVVYVLPCDDAPPKPIEIFVNSIHTDQNLRQALHRIYVAQFSAIQDFPGIFTKNDASRMLTGLMGSRPWSWRVIGITHAALDVFAQNDFKRVRGLIERGHITERSQTAQQLYFGRDDAMPIDEFYEFFLERDKTVLMAKPENKSCTENAPPDYLPVPAELQLFPCGSLIGWKHRTQEIEFLRQLHASQSAQTN